MPHGVYKLHQLKDYLENFTEELLSENRVQFAVGRIETARMAISSKTDVEHVEALKRRHGNKELH